MSVYRWRGGFREEKTIQAVFSDALSFYGRCFRYARAVDPDALLFYNDYNDYNVVLDSGKRNSIKQILEHFEKENYPIDGVGDQFYYMVITDKAQMKAGFKDMASTGLLMHISELDVRTNTKQLDIYIFNKTEERKQAVTYRGIVDLYETLPEDQKFATTPWGISDKQSWLLDRWHGKEYPLLFDNGYKKKKAYEGFLNALRESD